MSLNKYSSFIPIFSKLKHQCSKQLITKLFNILCWFKIELSDDLYSYVLILMIGSFKNDIRVVYAFDDNNKLQPISKLSYDFKIILEKYYGDNERGTNILKHISNQDYNNKLGVGYPDNSYKHFVNYSIIDSFKKSKIHFDTIKKNETQSLYNNIINFFSNNDTKIDNRETIVMCAHHWFRKPIYIILIFTHDNVEILICCVDCTFVEHFISPGNNTYQIYEEQYDNINEFVNDITENNIIDIKKKLVEFLIEENLSTYHTNLLLTTYHVNLLLKAKTIQPKCFLSGEHYNNLLNAMINKRVPNGDFYDNLPYEGRRNVFGFY